MKKMSVICLIFSLCISNLLVGEEVSAPKSNDTNFPNYNFPLTYPGVTMFMDDLSLYEKEDYDFLFPQYQKIKRKRNMSLIARIVLGSASLGLITTAMVATDPSTSSGQAMFFSGMGLLGGAGIVPMAVAPKRADYYRLVNMYNHENPDHQIEIETRILY